MPLREDFERSGNWLFRWRGYLPIVMLCVVLVAMRRYHYPGHSERLDHAWEAVCLAICFVGLGLRVLTIGYAPRDTGRNTAKQDAAVLNTTGLYSVVRNPLYLGNFFMYLGVVTFARIWWLVLVYLLVFCLYYERIIFAEEEYLRAKFGAQFLDWAARTPVIIPRLSGYRMSALPFSLKTVLRREYNGFFAVVVVLYAFELVGDLSARGRLEFDRGWLAIVAVSFVVWITLRTLKRHTRCLETDDR